MILSIDRLFYQPMKLIRKTTFYISSLNTIELDNHLMLRINYMVFDNYIIEFKSQKCEKRAYELTGIAKREN